MSVLDLGAAAGSRIGRYFGLVSVPAIRIARSLRVPAGLEWRVERSARLDTGWQRTCPPRGWRCRGTLRGHCSRRPNAPPAPVRARPVCTRVTGALPTWRAGRRSPARCATGAVLEGIHAQETGRSGDRRDCVHRRKKPQIGSGRRRPQWLPSKLPSQKEPTRSCQPGSATCCGGMNNSREHRLACKPSIWCRNLH